MKHDHDQNQYDYYFTCNYCYYLDVQPPEWNGWRGGDAASSAPPQHAPAPRPPRPPPPGEGSESTGVQLNQSKISNLSNF